MNDRLLQIQGVSYTYNRPGWKLDQISLDINKGDFVAIAGANGSGKSTLLKIMAGILLPERGQITLKDCPIKNIPRKLLARQIGYLPQQVNFVFNINVNELVLMGRFCHSKGLGISTANDRTIAEQCMDITEVSVFKERAMNELSGGERQRVLLASVLAQQPEIMLLDEPVNGLDMHHQISFFKLLSQLCAEGMTIVIITHDLNFASQFCDKILLLNKGKKEIYDSVEKAFEQIEQRKTYLQDMILLRHPINGKPMLLPYGCSDRENG